MHTQHAKGILLFRRDSMVVPGRIDQKRVLITLEKNRCLEDPLIFGAVGRRCMGHVDLAAEGGLIENAWPADQQPECPLGRLRKGVRLGAVVDEPVESLARMHYLKAFARLAGMLPDQAVVARNLRKGLAHGWAGMGQHSNNGQFGKVHLLGEVPRKCGGLGQFLGGSHELDEARYGHARLRVLQLIEQKTRTRFQLRPINALGDREAEQAARYSGGRSRFTHDLSRAIIKLKLCVIASGLRLDKLEHRIGVFAHMLLASNSRNAIRAQGAAGLAHDIPRRSLADKALRYATQFWFSVVVLGQWIFAAYIVAVYGRSAAAGDFAKWNEILPHGWEAGNHLGNTVLATHLMFAAAITTAGAVQLIPSLRTGFPSLHRWIGRAYILSAFLMGGSGLYLSWSGRKVVGDASQHVAVELSAFLILAFATLALLRALQRQFVAHRRWALRLFS